jgi:bifunctional UDP-N-acetylglucosamine pyrophosphorylase / glucosamine-1-phosphate N-acetyltransferase
LRPESSAIKRQETKRPIVKRRRARDNAGAMVKNKDVTIVVLAAGKGTRLKSSLAKVLHMAGGRPLVEHVVRACAGVGPKKVVVVVGHQAEKVQAITEPFGAETVLQQPQNGTGHAILVSRRAIGNAKYVVVLPGDAPLVRTETIRALIEKHKNGPAAATILTAVLADPSGYGRILRKGGDAVAAIIEESQLTADQRELNEINSSIYCFTTATLWPALAQVKPNNAHREIYLTDVISVLNAKGETVLAEIAADSREMLGCNTRADLAEVDHTFRELKREALMEDGVTIRLPETVVIDPDVTIGEDTVIEPCVQLLGKTKIGQRCVVKSGCVVSDSVLGDDVVLEPHCVITTSRIDAEAVAGPFARMRPDSHVKRGAKIGNFVELKKSMIGEGSKVPHLSYIGDTRIGAKANIGAGTITCNYDGFHKHPTTIGNKAFIGSDTTLVAPVRIGAGAYIAAGSTITENVPADALGVARGRQANKKGWATKKRRELAAAETPKKRSKKRR